MFRIISDKPLPDGPLPNEDGRRTQRRTQWLKGSLAFLLGLILFLGAHQTFVLYRAAQRPVDAVLVLGGSIRREMHAAELAKAQPDLPVLISGGSDEPCIWLIFEREGASMDQVWIEPCADSTLGNYRFTTPILKRWGARHIKLVTSGSHQQRAVGLGRIVLGGHGIWLSLDSVAEVGRPGNSESRLKTGLDWIRGAGWAVFSQVYSPRCETLHRLSDLRLAEWRDRPFECEHQGQVEIPPELRPAAGIASPRSQSSPSR